MQGNKNAQCVLQFCSGILPSIISVFQTKVTRNSCAVDVSLQPTECLVGYPVHGQNEIVFEEDVAHDGEEIDQDEGQHSSENNGAAIAGDALYYVEQGFLSVNQIKELQRESRSRRTFTMY